LEQQDGVSSDDGGGEEGGDGDGAHASRQGEQERLNRVTGIRCYWNLPWI
jgi:hypothetical protein